ncbi:SPRY domain-containing SOCS box protein 3 isoform X2 [Brachyhypopomus gauderio]|uniref:SPRY domain-containing SOCS box protein 3 isoform X2 n=1 Tax=Brachyhypopomus gauderio TaxID=698409 RepID=UPI0040412207
MGHAGTRKAAGGKQSAMPQTTDTGTHLRGGDRETETPPPVMTLDPQELGSVLQDYRPVTVCVPAKVPLAVPVTGQSFCQCPNQTDLSSNTHLDTHECTCGEDQSGCEWVWDESCRSPAVRLSCSSRTVTFHPDFSRGTAAVRGTTELRAGIQHFWEIKMTSPVYGTDMMVGIGTAEVNLNQFSHSFSSLLGSDTHSWGLSYTGLLHHEGVKVPFSSCYGQGSIIGLHLDTWHGTLTLYKNRLRIGVAATGLQNQTFYPMACSTAAQSSMKVIRSCSAPSSLLYLCCSHLRDLLAEGAGALSCPPGLSVQLHHCLGWVFTLGSKNTYHL